MSKALVKTAVGGVMLACWLGRLRQRQKRWRWRWRGSMEGAREIAGGLEKGREPGVSGPDSSSLRALCPQTAPGIRKTGRN